MAREEAAPTFETWRRRLEAAPRRDGEEVAHFLEVLRTIGFAHSPGVLNILGFIPILGGLIGLVVGIWTLVATIVAMRQALDFDTTKAVLTAIIGAIPAFRSC